MAINPPTGLSATKMIIGTNQLIYINWTAVQGATKYNVFRNDTLISGDTQNVGMFDFLSYVPLWDSAVYRVRAGNASEWSDFASVTFVHLPDDPLPYLITDRTQSDVDSMNAKGTYSPIDWNRVGAAVAYVTNALADKGYIVPTVPKTDWSNYDIPTASQLEQYRGNVDLIRTAVIELSNPDMPNSMSGLDYKEANALEQILLDVYDILDHINLVPCGLPSCGVLWDDYGG